MTDTPNRQRSEFSEGFALGLLLNGTDRLPPNSTSNELALRQAWRRWDHRAAFPAIGRYIDRRNEYALMTYAKQTRSTNLLYWQETDGIWTIHHRNLPININDADDVRECAEIISTVPAKGWADLAHTYLARTDETGSEK